MFTKRASKEAGEHMRDVFAMQLLKLGFVFDQVPHIGKKLSRLAVRFACRIGSADFTTWFAVAGALDRHNTEFWVNVSPTDEIIIRIVDSEHGTHDLFFVNKSTRYARVSLRMMWIHSIIRAKHATTPLSTEERAAINELINVPDIPARFVIPRVPEMYWDQISTFIEA